MNEGARPIRVCLDYENVVELLALGGTNARCCGRCVAVFPSDGSSAHRARTTERRRRSLASPPKTVKTAPTVFTAHTTPHNHTL